MSRESMMRKLGLKPEDFEPKPKQPEIINISRENFDLLNATQNNVIYYVVELDNTITVIEGENK